MRKNEKHITFIIIYSNVLNYLIYALTLNHINAVLVYNISQ